MSNVLNYDGGDGVLEFCAKVGVTVFVQNLRYDLGQHVKIAFPVGVGLHDVDHSQQELLSVDWLLLWHVLLVLPGGVRKGFAPAARLVSGDEQEAGRRATGANW
jgi:hypothetical protein